MEADKLVALAQKAIGELNGQLAQFETNLKNQTAQRVDIVINGVTAQLCPLIDGSYMIIPEAEISKEDIIKKLTS